jgi:hypothetical protein
MGFRPGQDGLIRTSFDTAQTTLAFFRPVNAGVVVEGKIHFSEYVLRADLQTVPTGLAAAGIQADVTGLGMT